MKNQRSSKYDDVIGILGRNGRDSDFDKSIASLPVFDDDDVVSFTIELVLHMRSNASP